VPDIRRSALAASAAVLAALPLAAAPANASAATFGTRTLSQGMRGGDVKTAQKLLNSVGDSGLTVDGQFGPATRKAVKVFETTEGLPSADGKIEPPEAPKLKSAAATAAAEGRTLSADDPATTTPTTTAAPTTDPAGGVPTDPAGGASTTPADPMGVPGAKALLNVDGTATAPASAPAEVKEIIAAGNEIASKPYRYGGGHGKWKDTGYDCSGSVSYALHGAGLLDQALPSGDFETWGDPGRGTWVTLYAKGSHMYMVVAGLRFDTSGAKPSRWQADMRSASGYTVRHPTGL
jgi:peptidoglycan hydrolase-like protein with peptidoglycan-binding domain